MTGTAESIRQVKPDPAQPQIINGDFGEASENAQLVPGWYYGRQVQLVRTTDAGGGAHVEFTNQQPGRGSHLMQGLAVDGRAVARLTLSTRYQGQEVRSTQSNALPSLIITFYDEERREVGKNWLGPWRGNVPWKTFSKTVRVPTAAREAIVRIGLFGAVGKAAFDDVRVGRVDN